MAENKSDLDKILDDTMKSLIGKRNWDVWKNDIEPEMYNSIREAMLIYGSKKWVQAQKQVVDKIKLPQFSRTVFNP
jgi:hypothetical protein